MIKNTIIVKFRDVNKYYGDLHVLKNINLDIGNGEVIIVVGPSGSGKSTLCRVINRLETIDNGIIEINGDALPAEAKDIASIRADIGMVFQSFNLFAHKTVLENITLGPTKVKKIPEPQAREEAMTLLQRVGMTEKAHKLPSQLSGGQQQRAAIARSLAMRPKIILFDEPTSALDPEMVNEVLDVMVELAREGMTMVVVTHEMNFARKAADRIIFMSAGEILEDAAPKTFFASPETERAKDFLSKILG